MVAPCGVPDLMFGSPARCRFLRVAERYFGFLLIRLNSDEARIKGMEIVGVLQNGAVIWALQIEIDQMVQLATVQKTSPNSKSSVDSPCRLPCVANAPKRSTAQIRPRRMAHVLCFTINVQEQSISTAACSGYACLTGQETASASCMAFMAVTTTCSHLRNQARPTSIIAAGMSGQSKRLMFAVCHELKSLMSVSYACHHASFLPF